MYNEMLVAKLFTKQLSREQKTVHMKMLLKYQSVKNAFARFTLEDCACW